MEQSVANKEWNLKVALACPELGLYLLRRPAVNWGFN